GRVAKRRRVAAGGRADTADEAGADVLGTVGARLAGAAERGAGRRLPLAAPGHPVAGRAPFGEHHDPLVPRLGDAEVALRVGDALLEADVLRGIAAVTGLTAAAVGIELAARPADARVGLAG